MPLGGCQPDLSDFETRHLFQDVAKYAEPGAIFVENYLSYSELCRAFNDKGMEIFANNDKG